MNMYAADVNNIFPSENGMFFTKKYNTVTCIVFIDKNIITSRNVTE